MLSNLTILILEFNTLTGTIPSKIGQITTLLRMDLSDNDLTGTIPTEIGTLSNLIELILEGNILEGTIPSEIGQITALLENPLSGEVPWEVCQLHMERDFDFEVAIFPTIDREKMDVGTLQRMILVESFKDSGYIILICAVFGQVMAKTMAVCMRCVCCPNV
eukprot:scaffold280686_cov30-Attheya_sp.AAC.1